MENLVLNIFCSMTLLKKNAKLLIYKQKTAFGDLLHLIPQIVGSLVSYSTSLVDYWGRVGK